MSASDDLAGLTLSSSDIAMLARVKRPVVSVWRSRSTDSKEPFPEPLFKDGTQERFDVESVVAWLAATGRGNNPSVHEDAAAVADLADGSSVRDDDMFSGLTALLCLGVITGSRIGDLDEDDLLDLADEADPDDEFLYDEVEALGARLTRVARFADLLADAAYSHAAAFEKLVDDRYRLHPSGATTLAEPARDLVARLCIALAADAGLETPTFVDPTLSSGDLLIALFGRLVDDHSSSALAAASDHPTSRLVRRRLRIHDVHRTNLLVADDGAYEVVEPAVHLAQFPAPASPGMSDDQILTAIDNIALQMRDEHRAVVVAPASVLVIKLRSAQSGRFRTDILRSGHVRAIVLLPKGLVRGKSRQQLALWVFGPAYGDVPLADRWTTIADLSNESITHGVTDDLVTDVVAALGSAAHVRAHAFRFGRVVFTRHLLATSGDLVQPVPGGVPSSLASAADLAVRIAGMTDSLAGQAYENPMEGRVAEVRLGDRPSDPHVVSLGQAVKAKDVRLLPGNRLDASDIGHGDGLRVIGCDELTGAADLGARTVDRLGFAAAYEGGRLTEPGDVVFCTTPRVAAMVDAEGASVVAYPARALRIAEANAGLDPHLLARDINAQPDSAKAWKSWPVRRIPRDQAVELADVFTRIEQELAAARRRLTQLDELTDLVVGGVSSGSLVINNSKEQEGS